MTFACGARDQPNILLISLDTLRADSLGSYGYSRSTSPFIDQLAAEGVRFENAFVNTLATTPSHVSILSSQYQEAHGVLYQPAQEEDLEGVIPESITLLPEVLAHAGYVTLGVTGAGRFAARHGFGRGFTEFDGSEPKGVLAGVDSLLAMWDRHPPDASPRFVLFHTYEIHAPYRPPPPFDTTFGDTPESDFVASSRNLREVIDSAAAILSDADFERIRLLYDGGILYTDDAMRRLFDGLQDRGFFDGDYLVVLTSDHGEEFGERGGVLHRGLLFDEFLHVPLILMGARVSSGEVRSDLVSSLDIAPTILAYAGLRTPKSMQGSDLLGNPPRPLDRQVLIAQYRDKRYAVRTPAWKYISSQTPELYDLSRDPGELENVAAENEERVQAFQAMIDNWRVAQEERRPAPIAGEELTPEQVEELRALGYIN